MRTCQGCGGVLGRDCWNEQECVWIGQQQDNDAYQQDSFVPQLENRINDFEIQLHLASNQVDYLQSENKRMSEALQMIEIMASDRVSKFGIHILGIAKQGLGEQKL